MTTEWSFLQLDLPYNQKQSLPTQCVTIAPPSLYEESLELHSPFEYACGTCCHSVGEDLEHIYCPIPALISDHPPVVNCDMVELWVPFVLILTQSQVGGDQYISYNKKDDDELMMMIVVVVVVNKLKRWKRSK